MLVHTSPSSRPSPHQLVNFQHCRSFLVTCCHSLMSAIEIFRKIRHVRPKLPLLLFTSPARLILHSALPSAFQSCRNACLPPCLHVNNAPEGERQKSVSRSSLVCHLPSPCISPDSLPPLKPGGKLWPSNPPHFSHAKAWIFYISASLLAPPPPHFFSTNSQTVCICISHAGLIRRRRAMQQQPGPGKRGGCHGDPTQGHLLSFLFFSLSPHF